MRAAAPARPLAFLAFTRPSSRAMAPFVMVRRPLSQGLRAEEGQGLLFAFCFADRDPFKPPHRHHLLLHNTVGRPRGTRLACCCRWSAFPKPSHAPRSHFPSCARLSFRVGARLPAFHLRGVLSAGHPGHAKMRRVSPVPHTSQQGPGGCAALSGNGRGEGRRDDKPEPSPARAATQLQPSTWQPERGSEVFRRARKTLKAREARRFLSRQRGPKPRLCTECSSAA